MLGFTVEFGDVRNFKGHIHFFSEILIDNLL